ncbi:MAG: AMP-binding enzyme, partial [Microcystaceae cyanobacterium]
FKTVLLGGATAWPSLLEQAKLHQINLAPTYGMSETASQIATLKAADFAKNHTGVGQVLPQAKVIITNEKGEVLKANQIGLVNIQSESLFLGYYPELKMFKSFCPGDLGYFDQKDYLHIIGRQDQQINTGGEKVFPGEVEAVILASNLVKDVIVFGLNDSRWGEVVVAVYVPKLPTFEIKLLQDYLKQHLAAYKVPKYWQNCLSLERSPSGKVNYAQLKAQFKADP